MFGMLIALSMTASEDTNLVIERAATFFVAMQQCELEKEYSLLFASEIRLLRATTTMSEDDISTVVGKKATQTTLDLVAARKLFQFCLKAREMSQ